MPGIFDWLREFVREYDRGTAVMRGGSPRKPSEELVIPASGGIKSEVEVLEDGTEAVIRIVLPNVNPEDLDVTLSRRDVLTVSGLVRNEQAPGSMDIAGITGLDGFREVVPLPPGFEDGATGASFEDGTLKLTFSRSNSEEEESRRVPLQDLNG